jgi:mannose-6-phosphate isomerase
MYPVLLQPILLDKVWGGDRLSKFGKKVSPGSKIGESWELADVATTTVGGGGGGAFHSAVLNGPFAKKTLHDLFASKGKSFLGETKLNAAGCYPLLLKFLDAHENLSVQVHPSPAYAAAHPGAMVKSECWYILDAEPGAVIFHGLKEGVTRAAFEKAIAAGKVVDLMNAVAVKPGECYHLPSGTCHALGAGVLAFEVQTTSDTTFRVFDWGRKGRELHIKEALECIDFDSRPSPPAVPDGSNHNSPFLSTPDFSLTMVEIGDEGFAISGFPGPFTIVSGSGHLQPGLKGFRPEPVRAGTTGFIPAFVSIESKLIGQAASPLRCIFVRPTAAS